MVRAEASRQKRGYDFIFFDCDSTLSAIEGIDELARSKGLFDEVSALTDAAMTGQVPLEDIYGRRLEMLTPTESEVALLADLYRETAVPDARRVIAALIAAGKEVFIISGGLLPAVRPFGLWLGVPDDHIRGVDIKHARPDEEPLITSHGKAVVVRDLLAGSIGRSMLIGDGVSDLAARDAVDLFVGFTGVIERRRVVEESEVLITGDSLAPVMGLALTASEEAALLDTEHAALIEESRARMGTGELVLKRGSPI